MKEFLSLVNTWGLKRGCGNRSFLFCPANQWGTVQAGEAAGICTVPPQTLRVPSCPGAAALIANSIIITTTTSLAHSSVLSSVFQESSVALLNPQPRFLLSRWPQETSASSSGQGVISRPSSKQQKTNNCSDQPIVIPRIEDISVCCARSFVISSPTGTAH